MDLCNLVERDVINNVYTKLEPKEITSIEEGFLVCNIFALEVEALFDH